MSFFKSESRQEGKWTIHEHTLGTDDTQLVHEIIDWCAALPNQHQYESVLNISVISDAGQPTYYQVKTHLYGDELGVEFKVRFHRA